jgi:hypothetical protein
MIVRAAGWENTLKLQEGSKMQKQEAAAIRMPQISDEVKVLFPASLDLEKLLRLNALEPFNADGVSFLDELSKALNKDSLIRNFPDVATFAFFCRKANILKLKEQYWKEELLRLGRGIVFHIAPSNVPVNFAFSLVCGILSGNSNVVRIPSKPFEQVDMICSAIAKLAGTGKHQQITDRIALVRYDRQSAATSWFSSICDVRVIWGGDETIADIRKNPIPPRAFDITFADRYSMCIINADQFVDELYPDKVAAGFYNDTYLFDQNACTSPHLVVWTGTGDNVNQSRKIFWGMLRKEINRKKYVLQSVSAVDKLTVFFSQAIESEGIQKADFNDNLICVNELKTLPAHIEDFRCAGGYFNDYHAASIYDIVPVINRKYQTLSYFGFDYAELADFMKSTSPSGIDRIVPIGKTTDFSLIWDGYDLIRTLSRICDIVE